MMYATMHATLHRFYALERYVSAIQRRELLLVILDRTPLTSVDTQCCVKHY
jgi:hypothetical protein